MSKKDEALKLALEALESGHSTVYGTSQAARAIAAIKEALAEKPAQQQEPVLRRIMQRLADLLDEDHFAEIESIVAGAGVTPPAQRQVVAHQPCKGMNCGITRTDQEHSLECQAEHAAAIAGGAFVKPSQQEPLTDEQIDELARATFDVVQEMPDYQVNGDTWDREFARAIEAKLREKNHG